jgi:cellobiose phosphorylase
MLANRYGQFDSDGRSFVINDHRTPMPWCNVVTNGRFGFIVSQNGGGFSWFDDAQHCVLTRWEMDLVRDQAGKYLYIADRESGKTWSAAPAPCWEKFDSYQCTHTLGSTTFKTSAHGIDSAWTLFVAPRDQAELWLLKLTNTGKTPRKLRISSYFDWCCGVAPDAKREFHRLFFTTSHDAKRRAIVAVKNMWDIPPKNEKQHWNQPWPYVAAHSMSGTYERGLAIADKSTFLGRYGQPNAPKAMHGDIPADGRFGRFGDAAAALGGDITLAPGQSIELHWTLAIGQDHASCMSAIDKFAKLENVKLALDDAHAMWRDTLAPTHVQSQRADFDLLNNHWLRYQAISGRLWGRTGYYQQSGAFGFRDQLQDTHVWLPIDPQRTIDHIEYAATRQFVDGSVNHWWHALADFGNHTACSDDYLWLAYLTCGYIKETGDWAALHRKKIPFRDDPKLATDLMDHCLRSIKRSLNRLSPRGIPLIGSCDWNDGLSAMGVDEKGESVWLGWFLATILRDFEHVLRHEGDTDTAEMFAARRQKLLHDINAVAWDGHWYRYGTKDSGEWIGSRDSAEGQIHLNAQTWGIISDGAPSERVSAAWASVKERLLSSYGPLLLEPAYTVPDATIGYITRYSPGSRENGGVYMHAATWALLAACKLKDAPAVEKIWNSIAPPTRCAGDAEKYWAEPYVLPGNVDGPLSELPGRAGWTWYTGSAAWLNKVSLEWVLGIRPTWDGLAIDPCIPESFGTVNAKRVWRGRKLEIEIDPSSAAGGQMIVELNGKPLAGSIVRADQLPEGATGKVRVRFVHAGASASAKAGTGSVPRNPGAG